MPGFEVSQYLPLLPAERSMETFISGVRAHPCLWNPLHPDYREMQIRDDAWRRIVKQCNNDSIPNVKSARIEWKRLRDNHRQALRRAKLGQNKLLPAQITTWKYAKAMQFLEPHMSYRITENIEMDPIETPTKTPDYDVSTTDASATELKDSNKHRCMNCTSEITTSPPDTDALEAFFNCMLKSTRHMPQWMQTQVKKKIFAVIIDAEESLSSGKINLHDSSDFTNVKKIKTEVYSDDDSIQ